MKAVYVTATLLLSSWWLRAKFITITTCQNVSEICEWQQSSFCSYSSLLVRQGRWTDVLLHPMMVIQEKNNSLCNEGGTCCFVIAVFISSIRTYNQENNTSLWYTCKSCTHLTFKLINYLSFWNFHLTQRRKFNSLTESLIKDIYIYVSSYFSIKFFGNNCFNSFNWQISLHSSSYEYWDHTLYQIPKLQCFYKIFWCNNQ